MEDDDRIDRLSAIFESVTDGSTFVEEQLEDGPRVLTESAASRTVGPAELHGLTDSIGEPDVESALE